MKEKTLGEVAKIAAISTPLVLGVDAAWDAAAAAVIAEHERRKWRPIRTCPNDDTNIIAGFYDGGIWVQDMSKASDLRSDPIYTHWQDAPEGPKQ